MLADMPWFNNLLASLLSDARDATPSPFLLFYSSLSITSTFLLPILFVLLCYLILAVVSRITMDKNGTAVNIALVVYNYFLGGLSFATAACVQGAFLNPVTNNFILSTVFYLFGIVLFVVVLGEAIWSTVKDS